MRPVDQANHERGNFYENQVYRMIRTLRYATDLTFRLALKQYRVLQYRLEAYPARVDYRRVQLGRYGRR